MSNYPDGQPYYPSNTYGGQYRNSSYTISNNGQQGPNRRSSFDTGDDTSMFDQSQHPSQTSQYYNYGQSQQSQAQPYRAPSNSAQSNLPYRTPSQQQLGGYQHHTHPSAASHASYNPAQYSTQASYNAQPYGNQSGAYTAGGYQAGYQPYVPAAYSDQQVNRTASTYNYHASGPQHGYDVAAATSQRPHLPNSPAQSYPSDAFRGHSGYVSMPSPPAPAPPPHQETTRPHSHSYSGGHDIYGTQYGYSDHPSNRTSDVNRNHSSASRTSNVSYQYANQSQLTSGELPNQNPAHHSAHTGTTFERHPQGRTLPGLPSESESDNDHYGPSATTATGYEDLMHTLDAAIGTSSQPRTSHNINIQNDPLFTPASPHLALSPDERPTHNGIMSTGETNINYPAFANDSDAEAAAGLAAMQAADEQEAAEEARRHSSHVQSVSTDPRSSDLERSDDSDYAGYGDLSLAGGGYAATMHYGDEPFMSATGGMYGQNDRLNPRMTSMRSSGVSSDGRMSQVSGYSLDTTQPFPTLPPEMARVDAGGTGGLTEPSSHPRRLSYEDGDEVRLDAESDIGEQDAIPDLFFHPGMSPNRPLPPPPSASDSVLRSSQRLSIQALNVQSRYSSYDQLPRLYPTAPDAYHHDSLSPSMVPRSTSLASNRSQPRTEQPMRSKTDADKARLLKQKQGAGFLHDGYESITPKTDLGTPLDLPTIPKKKLDPGKISAEVFKKCSEPWAMSSVFAWIKSLTDEETDLKESTLNDAITALFLHKVPTMSTIDAESLGQQFVEDMYSNKVLVKDEEWVKYAPGFMSGVMYQLTGLGCYSLRLHVPPEVATARCYSFHCMRTVKKAELNIPTSPPEDIPWPTYHNLTKEVMESRGKKEFERQCNLREIISKEDSFLFGLDLLGKMYRDQLAKANPPIISSKRLPGFLKDVFGLVEKVKKVNEEFLAPQLKYREKEQGPWVAGFSDIFREFIRRARPIYVDFAARYPKADQMIRDEEKRNPAFATFLAERQRQNASRLGWDSYMKSPITRLQRYILALETVMKLSTQQNDEKTNLAFAIDELKATAHDADVRVNEVNKQLELTALEKKIRLRKHPGDEVDLALNHLGRSIILRGDLQRLGGKGMSWVPTHAILFDHYLVLAKPLRDPHGNEVYDASKPPIPMGLIQLESSNDPAMMKSSMRGVTAVSSGAAGRAAPSPDPRLARTTSGQTSGAPLVHTATGLSTGSGGTGSMTGVSMADQDSKEDRILYPFRVKHLGRTEVYTLYALSADKRQEWCEAIISAKTQHAEALYTQNAEPFKLRVLADTAFGTEYSASTHRRTVINGTPLDRAVREVEKRYAGHGRPAPICRTAVNCATVFYQPQGKIMCAIGTDSGVYISEYQNPRGWIRSIQMNRVTQVAVLEEFNLLILLSDKQLIAYHLDVVCPPNGPSVPQADASVRKAPQKLSGSKDVGFFLAGKQKDRVLVLYQKRDGINSIFKVLEPVLQKSATSKSRWLGSNRGRGQTEFFREYDEFYIPAETYGLHMFHSSLAVATKKGMEVLTLDRKITWGVPNLESDSQETRSHLALIRERLKDLRPLGMFRLSDAEFLVAFTECAVYVNKLGDISRSVTMEFVGRANNACLYYPYLILFNDDFVEIRDAQNGRMKQVIAGRDIHMLDDGGNATPGSGSTGASLGGGANGLGVQGYNQAPKTVKLSMQHPEYEKSYIVVELLLAEQR